MLVYVPVAGVVGRMGAAHKWLHRYRELWNVQQAIKAAKGIKAAAEGTQQAAEITADKLKWLTRSNSQEFFNWVNKIFRSKVSAGARSAESIADDAIKILGIDDAHDLKDALKNILTGNASDGQFHMLGKAITKILPSNLALDGILQFKIS